MLLDHENCEISGNIWTFHTSQLDLHYCVCYIVSNCYVYINTDKLTKCHDCLYPMLNRRDWMHCKLEKQQICVLLCIIVGVSNI